MKYHILINLTSLISTKSHQEFNIIFNKHIHNETLENNEIDVLNKIKSYAIIVLSDKKICYENFLGKNTIINSQDELDKLENNLENILSLNEVISNKGFYTVLLRSDLKTQIFVLLSVFCHANNNDRKFTIRNNKINKVNYTSTIFSKFTNLNIKCKRTFDAVDTVDTSRITELPIFRKNNNVLFLGNLQNNIMMKNISVYSLELLNFNNIFIDFSDNVYFMDMRLSIQQQQTLSINTLTNYYNKCLELIHNNNNNNNVTIYAVCDNTIDTQLKLLKYTNINIKYKFTNNISELEILYLVTSCKKGGIIINNLFSWWCGFMNKQINNSNIYMPDNWFNLNNHIDVIGDITYFTRVDYKLKILNLICDFGSNETKSCNHHIRNMLTYLIDNYSYIKISLDEIISNINDIKNYIKTYYEKNIQYDKINLLSYEGVSSFKNIVNKLVKSMNLCFVIDDIHHQGNMYRYRKKIFPQCKYLFLTYAYHYEHRYPRHNNVYLLPHSISYSVEFNNNPINKILVSGHLNLSIYPNRNLAVQLSENNENIVLFKPDYKGYIINDNNTDKTFGLKYYNLLNSYLACFADDATLERRYIVAKFFEITGVGSLLIAFNKNTIDIFTELGFIDKVHYLSVSEDNYKEVVDYVLDSNNLEEINKIRYNGYIHTNKYHTFKNRAIHLNNILCENNLSDEYNIDSITNTQYIKYVLE